MDTSLAFAAALLMGVFGSIHCAGMCGGIAAAFSTALPRETRASVLRATPWVLAYNAGRIASYAVAGALAGLLGQGMTDLLTPELARGVGTVVAASFMVALGLYLGGWWRGLALIERVGLRLWRHLQPLARRLLPVDSAAKALAAGALWGWLPCGLVYAALAWSLGAGGALRGAALMAVFGIGTLPVLVVFGLAGGRLDEWVKGTLARRAAGGLVLAAGIATLLGGPLLHPAGHGM